MKVSRTILTRSIHQKPAHLILYSVFLFALIFTAASHFTHGVPISDFAALGNWFLLLYMAGKAMIVASDSSKSMNRRYWLASFWCAVLSLYVRQPDYDFWMTDSHFHIFKDLAILLVFLATFIILLKAEREARVAKQVAILTP